MEKREWIFLGFLGSIIGLLVWLLINVAFGTYSVPAPLYAFVYSLTYFITWSTVGYYFFQKKIRKKKTKFEILEKS